MRKSKDDSWRHFRFEQDAGAFLLSKLPKQFCTLEQVCAESLVGKSAFRLDAVSVVSEESYVIGWEFKASHLYKSEFAAGLKQACDYRGATINDARVPALQGRMLDACILFPDWDGLHDSGENEFAGEAAGMRLLASHFRVGTAKFDQRHERLSIIVGEQVIWRSDRGWSANATGVLKGKRRLGSGRVADQSRR